MRFLDGPLAAGLALGLALSCAMPARAQLADVHGAVRIVAGTAMKYLDEPWEFAGGVGYFHEVDKSIDYKRSELAWNGGIGLRVRLSERIFLAPEFRIGHLTRATISLGYLF